MLTRYNTNGALIQALTSGFLLVGLQVFKVAGSNTYTPTAGVCAVLVECIGGGGGGFNAANATAAQMICAGGGAGGAYSAKFLSILPTDTFNASVGAGGSTTGGSGTNTQFIDRANSAVVCCAFGGTAGTTITTGTSEIYGTTGGGSSGSSIGDVGFDVNQAVLAHRVSATIGVAGKGGCGPSGGRPIGTIAQGAGAAGGKYGGGGSGGVSINAGGTAAGGAGGTGIVIVWEFTR